MRASVSERTATAGSPGSEASGLLRSTTLRSTGLLIAAAALAVVFLLSLGVGARPVPPDVLWQLLWAPDGGEESYVLHGMRLPRGWLAVAVGAALGVAGALIQALTRNPLADTGILGVGAGGSFAVTVGVAFFGATAISQYLWFAFAGAIIVTVLVYTLGSVGALGATPVRLTLVGVAIGAVLTGITSAITMLNPRVFDDMLRWSAGSLAGRGWDTVATIAPVIVVGIVLGLCCTRPLNAVALGDDHARSLGANLVLTRVLVIVAVTLLAGAATAAAGPIGFVGLMVPHVVRWFTGPDQRWIVAYTAIVAPTLLLASDVVARVLLAPQEIEVGVVTAFLGAPVLILLARRKQASGL